MYIYNIDEYQRHKVPPAKADIMRQHFDDDFFDEEGDLILDNRDIESALFLVEN